MNKDDRKLMQQFCEIPEIEIEIGDWVNVYFDEPPFLVIRKDRHIDICVSDEPTDFLILQENDSYRRSSFMIEEGWCILDKKSNILQKVEDYLRIKKFRIENIDSPNMYGTIRHSIKIKHIEDGRNFVKQADNKLWKALVISCIKINNYERSIKDK